MVDTLDFLVASFGPADPRWERSLRELALTDDPTDAVRELIGEASRCAAVPQLARAAVSSLDLVQDSASDALAERWRALWAEAHGDGELGVAARIIESSTRARAEGSERALFELGAAERRLLAVLHTNC